MKVLPFVVPPNEQKMELIKFAEKLLTEEIALKKASVATPDGTFEFGLFPTGTEILGAYLARDTEGKIIDGMVSQFTCPEGLEWFQKMQQRVL
jgi:hypothetical protein